MERVLSGELSRVLLILGVGVFSLSALLYARAEKIRESFKSYQKPNAWYLLISLFFFALAAIAEWLLSIEIKSVIFFHVCQAYFLLLGIAHVCLMHHFLKWSGNGKPFWMEMVFTLIVSMLGCMIFVVIYRRINNEGVELMVAGSIFMFIIPLLLHESFNRAIDIPPKVVRHWFYPINEKITAPDETKLRNLLLISFEFQKHTSDTLITNFRAKAPTDMDFGQLFYYFINDYHERHPTSKIEITDDAGEAYGWIFYKKPRWYSIWTHYIDIDNTIYLNQIRENDIIICSRSHH